jgi:hypothetical protein
MANYSIPFDTPQEYLAPKLTRSDVNRIRALHGFATAMVMVIVLALAFLGFSLFSSYTSKISRFDDTQLTKVETELTNLKRGEVVYQAALKAVNGRLPASLPYYTATHTLPPGVTLRSIAYTIDNAPGSKKQKFFEAIVKVQGEGPEGSRPDLEKYVGDINALPATQLAGFTPSATIEQSSIVKGPSTPGVITAPVLQFSATITLTTPENE